MKVGILIASRNRPDLVDQIVGALRRSVKIDNEIVVVECGTEPDRLSRHSTISYADPDFRGKCFGHNVALRYAQLAGGCDYYWVLMNDLLLPESIDPAAALVDVMESEPRMAVLSPTNVDAKYENAVQPGGGWRAAAACDYLGFMMRAAAIDDAGFLNPAFHYCWGAADELAYNLYRRGWFLAYTDDVTYKHLGGSTYGKQDTKTISRAEYKRRAKRFAYDYMRENYGDNWDDVFWAAAADHDIEHNTYKRHKDFWAAAFSKAELPARTPSAPVVPSAGPTAADAQEAEEGEVKLHLGSGGRKRVGWINVDANPETSPDVVARAEYLPMFPDGSVDVIESCHLFEHFAYLEAIKALKEWYRVLKPGGRLFVELPDFGACIDMLGKYKDPEGYDFGMIGIFGYPPAIRKQGHFQTHKWGWTAKSLGRELRAAGFTEVQVLPISQTQRRAAKTGRDMRVCAVRGVRLRRAALAADPRPDDRLAATRSPAVETRVGNAIDLPALAPAALSMAVPATSTALADGPPAAVSGELARERLEQAIGELNPWFYPLTVGGIRVVPGIRSSVSRAYLENRTRCRERQLVYEVCQRYDVSGKSVLDLACNCGYWSARYAERGAVRVLGVEGRELFRRQAALYWETNGYLPEGSCRFVAGNVAEEQTWHGIRKEAPYDLTVCAGILYHVPNYREILEWASGVTAEAMVVDTRVGDGCEEPVEEPGDLCFNAIEQTRLKVVPHLPSLLGVLRSLAFEPEVLPVSFPTGEGVTGPDDYAAGRRVTVLATRRQAG